MSHQEPSKVMDRFKGEQMRSRRRELLMEADRHGSLQIALGQSKYEDVTRREAARGLERLGLISIYTDRGMDHRRRPRNGVRFYRLTGLGVLTVLLYRDELRRNLPIRWHHLGEYLTRHGMAVA